MLQPGSASTDIGHVVKFFLPLRSAVAVREMAGAEARDSHQKKTFKPISTPFWRVLKLVSRSAPLL